MLDLVRELDSMAFSTETPRSPYKGPAMAILSGILN